MGAELGHAHSLQGLRVTTSLPDVESIAATQFRILPQPASCNRVRADGACLQWRLIRGTTKRLPRATAQPQRGCEISRARRTGRVAAVDSLGNR